MMGTERITEGMINVIKRVRYDVSSVNVWIAIHVINAQNY